MKLKITPVSVNSKRLFLSINELVEEGIVTSRVSWSNDEERELFCDFLNSMFHEIYDTGFIEQWKIKCNKQNNKMEDILEGRINLEVHYKQRNCLNITKIKYEIQE